MKKADDSSTHHAVIAELFEKYFIKLVTNLAEENKIKKGEFAQRVWPESTSQVARNRWNGMRTEDCRTGKPLTCTLSDAFRMARILGLQVAYVALQAENLAEQRFKQMTLADETPQVKPQNPRRRRKSEAAEDQSTEQE